MSASTCTSLSAPGSKCAVSGGYRLSPTSGTQGGSFIDCYTDCAATAACEGFSYSESVDGGTSFCVKCNSNDASALDVDARVTHYAMCDPPGSPPAPPSLPPPPPPQPPPSPPSTCTSLSAAGSKCAASGGYRLSPTSGTQGGSFIDCYTDCAAAAACEGFS